jgi:plastocyanin
MNKLPLLLIVLAVAASGCTSMAESAQSDVENADEALKDAQGSDVYTVKYMDSGFKPKRLVIRQGDRVKWISRSGEGLELTFPQSENCGQNMSVMNTCGEKAEYSFKFEKTGTYNFYSDSDRAHRGMVDVQQRGLR